MSDTRNSIRISIHDKIKDTAEHYGYSVKIADTPTYHYYYKRDSNGMLKKVKDTENPTFSQYIELCISTFASLCQHGKMVRKGYTLNDNGDEVKIRRGRGDTAFSFIDTTTRTEYNYSSKREAAQQFFVCDESENNRNRPGDARCVKVIRAAAEQLEHGAEICLFKQSVEDTLPAYGNKYLFGDIKTDKVNGCREHAENKICYDFTGEEFVDNFAWERLFFEEPEKDFS